MTNRKSKTTATTAPTTETVVPAGPPTVKIGKHTATLRDCPGLLAVGLSRSEAEMQAMDAAQVVALGAAALAGCWPADQTWPARLRPRPWNAGQRVDRYGQEVYDTLHAAGLPTMDLIRACQAALRWAWTALVTEDEVGAAEGNFEPQGAGA